MKRGLAFIVVALLIFVYSSASNISSAVVAVNHAAANIITPAESFPDITTLKIKQIEKLLNRKLKLKEKLAIKFYQWKIKKNIQLVKVRDYKDKGKTALTFGIIGLVSLLLFPVGFFGLLPAFVFGLAAIMLGKKAKKEKPDDKKAKTAVILGWITLGIITAAAIFIIAFVLSISGGEK